MRSILMLLLTVGCDDGPGPKDETTCDLSWGTSSDYPCDFACKSMPTDAELVGGPCETNGFLFGNPMRHNCDRTFDGGGVYGCCWDFGNTEFSADFGQSEPFRERRVFFFTCK